jgi:hypothetical protein
MLEKMSKDFQSRLKKSVQEIEDLGISKDDYIVVGSSVMSTLLLREPGDIDIAVRPSVYFHLIKDVSIKNRIIRESGTINISEDCQILLNRYSDIRIFDENLFSENKYTFKLNDINFSRPELEVAKKIIRNYDKDIKDVELLMDYAMDNPMWDWNMMSLARPMTIKEMLIKGLKKVFISPFSTYRKFKIILLRRLNRGLRGTRLSVNTMPVKSLDVGILIQWQMVNGKLARYDFLMRSRVVEAYLKNCNKNDEFQDDSLENYKMMQSYRGSTRGTTKRFLNLMNSVIKSGVDPARFPIVLNRHGDIFDGSHRVACVLALGQNYIPVQINKFISIRPEYGREWFLEKFNQSVVDDLDALACKILIKTGAAFQLMIWPSANKYSSEISEYLGLNKSVNIISEKHNINFENFENFENFTKDFYSLDGIANWKVARKIVYMRSFEPQVSVITFTVDDPMYRLNTSTGAPLSDAAAQIKADVRNQFKSKFNDYFGDIVCHCGDNPQMNREMIYLFKEYNILIDRSDAKV